MRGIQKVPEAPSGKQKKTSKNASDGPPRLREEHPGGIARLRRIWNTDERLNANDGWVGLKALTPHTAVSKTRERERICRNPNTGRVIKPPARTDAFRRQSAFETQQAEGHGWSKGCWEGCWHAETRGGDLFLAQLSTAFTAQSEKPFWGLWKIARLHFNYVCHIACALSSVLPLILTLHISLSSP